MSGETFRGGVHFVVGGFAAALTLYNVMRYAEDHETRNLVNIIAYAGLFGLEWKNTQHHLRKPCC